MALQRGLKLLLFGIVLALSIYAGMTTKFRFLELHLNLMLGQENLGISHKFWTLGLPEGVLSNHPCPCIRPFVRPY